jgi:hypothetical protein
VLFTNGPGVAVADEKGLNIFYDNGVMNVDTAPFFLALIVGGRSFSMDSSLFPQFGFAVYVTEEIGRAQSMIGQSSDAWVELFRQKDALLPLAQAWDLRMPENEEQMFDFMRGLIEGGSFTRWVAKTYGLKAAQDLRDGWKIESITGLSLAEAEKAWLAAVAAQQLQPKSCELALPSLFPRSFCRKLESG